jgi:hypothetical protein
MKTPCFIEQKTFIAQEGFSTTLIELYKNGWKLISATNPSELTHFFIMENDETFKLNSPSESA